ncbi:brachyurin-like [Choristoneura fumiferana]|uniref:brachyurin-like n=1 Tax=Choristoneura fumiferana TaxID=7141 RepID=UPI003D154DD4
MVEAEKIRSAEQLMEENRTQDRIVGGSFASENEHPYLAGLLIDLVGTSAVSVCGASLLSANRLVGAAHCWYDGTWQAFRYTVVLGTLTLFSGGTRVATDQVVVFNTWDPVTYTHDIAMIYLPIDVVFSASIAPIALPEGIELFMTFDGETGVAAGYGRTSDQQLGIQQTASVSHVALRIVSTFYCRSVFGFTVTEWNMCTDGLGGVGVCGGDTGGPLVVYSHGRSVLVGVTSFTSRDGCQVGHPSGYTRVTSYHNFIRQHL